MKIVFLGTNGWYDSPTGNTICILIETDESSILLDAGNGFSKADRYIGRNKPVSLFISHTHLDHIIGLHTLNKFEFRKGLTIYCQSGTKAALQTVFAHPYSMPLVDLAYPVDIVEFERIIEKPEYVVQTAALNHSVPTTGFRVSIDNKIIVYCPDTGYCENAVRLSKNADLLIAECAFRSGEESDHWPHLNPESAARIALEAHVKQLALVHFDAFRYPTPASRLQAQEQAQLIFQKTFAAIDEQVLEL